MARRPGKIGWLGVLAGWLAVGAGGLSAQQPRPELELPRSAKPGGSGAKPSAAPATLPLDGIAPDLRDSVRAVVEKPTLSVRGPAEVFTCRPEVYFWLLDNPDQGVRLWRALGAKCTNIERDDRRGFRWRDEQGSGIHWDAVLATPRRHVWYAAGRVNPGMMLPMVDVQAVVVVDHVEGVEGGGRPAMRHQVDLYLKIDGHAAALAAKFFGASSPRLAEQYVGQIALFFAALAWYLDQHPKQAEVLLDRLRRETQASPAASGASRGDG